MIWKHEFIEPLRPNDVKLKMEWNWKIISNLNTEMTNLIICFV